MAPAITGIDKRRYSILLLPWFRRNFLLPACLSSRVAFDLKGQVCSHSNPCRRKQISGRLFSYPTQRETGASTGTEDFIQNYVRRVRVASEQQKGENVTRCEDVSNFRASCAVCQSVSVCNQLLVVPSGSEERLGGRKSDGL